MKLRSQLLLLALMIGFGLACLSVNAHAQETKPAKATDQATPKKRKPNPAMDPIEDVAGLPRVLLIGDSISIGYTVQTRAALQGQANVHRPPTNCGPSSKGVNELDQWLGDKKWDVIHFNFGLHDLKYMGPNGENLQDPADPKNKQQVPPEEYEKNLRALVERLKKTNAKLIWRNTTPVPAGAKGRVVEDAVKYNAIAERVMQENEIEVHDMYSMVKPKMTEMMQPNGNVHFNQEGCEELGQDVAAVILRALGNQRP